MAVGLVFSNADKAIVEEISALDEALNQA